jgi:hypothetical protein
MPRAPEVSRRRARSSRRASAAGRAQTSKSRAGACTAATSRLEAHRRAAHVELLNALADLPDTFAASLLARPSDYQASRRLFAVLPLAHSRSITLLQLYGDAGGVQTLACLFDDSCARLRRLEVFARAAATGASEGDEQCTPHDSQPTAAQLPSRQTQPTALTRA